MDVSGRVERLELATTSRQRLRGLLFRSPDSVTRLLVPCKDIHTFGMLYPIDVAFISKEGKVIEVHRDVSCMRRIRNPHASMVAERFANAGEWLKKGDEIHLGSNI